MSSYVCLCVYSVPVILNEEQKLLRLWHWNSSFIPGFPIHFGLLFGFAQLSLSPSPSLSRCLSIPPTMVSCFRSLSSSRWLATLPLNMPSLDSLMSGRLLNTTNLNTHPAFSACDIRNKYYL